MSDGISSIRAKELAVMADRALEVVVLQATTAAPAEQPETVTTFHFDSKQALELARLLIDAVQALESPQSPQGEGLAH